MGPFAAPMARWPRLAGARLAASPRAGGEAAQCVIARGQAERYR